MEIRSFIVLSACFALAALAGCAPVLRHSDGVRITGSVIPVDAGFVAR